jgi:hypothetical protein
MTTRLQRVQQPWVAVTGKKGRATRPGGHKTAERIAGRVYLPGSWPHGGLQIAPDAVTAEDVAALMRTQLSPEAQDLAFLGDGEPGRGYVIYLAESPRRERGHPRSERGAWTSFGDRAVLARRRADHRAWLWPGLRISNLRGRRAGPAS